MAEYGVLAVEMEASALYTLAAKYGRQALAICTVSDHILTGEETTAAGAAGDLRSMVEVALTAMLELTVAVGPAQHLLQLLPAGQVVVDHDLAVAHVVERRPDPLERDARAAPTRRAGRPRAAAGRRCAPGWSSSRR